MVKLSTEGKSLDCNWDYFRFRFVQSVLNLNDGGLVVWFGYKIRGPGKRSNYLDLVFDVYTFHFSEVAERYFSFQY